MGLSALLLTAMLWQRNTDLSKGSEGTAWQPGTLSLIEILGLLYFLAYFSAQNPNGVEQCKSEKLSWAWAS